MPKSPSTVSQNGLDVVVLGPAETVRLHFDVRVDNQPVSARWNNLFVELVKWYDRNADGSLDQREATLLPSAFALRQTLWQPFNTFPGTAPSWSTLDTNHDGKVNATELSVFYQRRGLGEVIVGIGYPPESNALNGRLRHVLDVNSNGQVNEDEWKKAAATLKPLDQNTDELIDANELVAGASYPGAAAGAVITPACSEAIEPLSSHRLPIIVLPHNHADLAWVAEILRFRNGDGDAVLSKQEAALSDQEFSRCDNNGDGKLTVEELVRWGELPPTVGLKAQFLQQAFDRPTLEPSTCSLELLKRGTTWEAEADRLQITFRVDPGQFPAAILRARNLIRERFEEADADRNHTVRMEDLGNPHHNSLKSLLPQADRNRDKNLSQQEFTEWLELQDQLARSQVLMTILDHGQGLFEVLDENRDGALSVRELDDSWDRLTACNCLADGRFDGEKLPNSLTIVVSRGLPKSLVASREERLDGPAWFRAMDRNGDGDLSLPEFVGPKEKFLQLDRNGNQVLDANEAAN